MNVATAGAYIEIDGLRVGGHLEPGESPWQCAAREAMEETGLAIAPVSPRLTLTSHREDVDFRPFPWDGPGPQPVLVLPRSPELDSPCNVMYLARATGAPRPQNEVNGLLLLRPDEVRLLCSRPTTLAEFLAEGGQAIMRRPYPQEMLLEPVLQSRLLPRLLVQGHGLGQSSKFAT